MSTTILVNLFIESVYKKVTTNDIENHLKLITMISVAIIGARLRDL